MHPFRLHVVASALLVLSAIAACRTAPPPPPRTQMSDLTHYRQPDSGVDAEHFVLLRTPTDVDKPRRPEALSALVKRVVTGTGVDLGEQSMLIYTMGRRSTHGYWCRVHKVAVEGDRLHIEIRKHRPTKQERPTPGEQTPYCAVAMPPVPEAVRAVQYSIVDDRNPSVHRSGVLELAN